MHRRWQIGDFIEGRWEIYNILQGGTGIVYIVYDSQFQEPFAAKTFRDEIYEQNPDLAPRFTREALAWIGLDSHPNIVQARMVETIDSKPFLFLEYVSGGDLSHWIGTPRLTEDIGQVLRFAIEFCDGMIHASSKGMGVHRDIKPNNCLVTRDRSLKVTDFGLVKLLAPTRPYDVPAPSALLGESSLTVASLGTCTHMAPEQFDDAQSVDVRADIYSFGVMLYQMVEGTLPFTGETWDDLEFKHKQQSPPQLKHPDHELRELVATCLAKRPEQRPANFEHVRRRLAAIYERVTGRPTLIPARGAELNAMEWNNKGSSLGNLGRQEQALACYEHAIRLHPQFAQAWFNKGVALYSLKRSKEALQCYERALALNPGLEQAWSNKGVALKSLGRKQEALDCYERALQLNPRYPEAWINKGVALRASQRAEEAIDCYTRALQLNPRDEKAWTNKGNALYSAGRMRDAIPCFDRALELNASLGEVWLNKGLALLALQHMQEALTCFDKAVSLAPRLEQAWFYKAATLVNGFQRYSEALPYFEEAARRGVAQAAQGAELCREMLREK